LKRPGVHCKAKFLKKIKSSDLRKNPHLIMPKYYCKQSPTVIDENTFIYHDSIFGYAVIELDYSNWIGTNYQNLGNSNFSKHVGIQEIKTTEIYTKIIGEKKKEAVNCLPQLKLIYENDKFVCRQTIWNKS